MIVIYYLDMSGSLPHALLMIFEGPFISYSLFRRFLSFNFRQWKSNIILLTEKVNGYYITD